MLRSIAILACVIIILSGAQRARAAALTDAPLPVSNSLQGTNDRRIVHQFDFDEHDEGNVETWPKHWAALRPKGFPGFTHGTFDYAIGHTRPPSFRIESKGRNVAFQYIGPDLPVRGSTDYRVEGYILAHQLNEARACLGACYLDALGRPLLDTLVRSRYLGGPGEAEGWIKVDLSLPAAPVDAATIALSAWVLQESSWNDAPAALRPIAVTDVAATAWLDDISVHALPRVEFSTSAPGNVLLDKGPQELLVLLADRDDPLLHADVTVRGADGRTWLERRVKVNMQPSPMPERIDLSNLPPGAYDARLDVHSGSTSITVRAQAFVRLAASERKGRTGTRTFGVVMEPGLRGEADAERALLRHQVVRNVKFPLWTGASEDTADAGESRRTERYFQSLIKDGFSITGVFVEPPGDVMRQDGPFTRSLVDLLAERGDLLRRQLSDTASPYASIFHAWQLGPDGAPLSADADIIDRAVENLRAGLSEFITAPELAGVSAMQIDPEQRTLPFDRVALVFGAGLRPEAAADELARWQTAGYEKLDVYVPPLPKERYQRLPRLSDWAQRLIAARHSGADVVYSPQTWRVRDTLHGFDVEPTEEYVLLRNIADVIGDARPAQSIQLDMSARCMAFHRGDTMVLAVWDATAPPEGTARPLQLGTAERQIDLWGRATPLSRDAHGRQLVTLSPMPVFIDNVSSWVMDFQTSLSFTPSHVESSVERVQHTLEIPNLGARAISGSVQLLGPDLWEITPRQFNFNVLPQRTQTFNVEIRYPRKAAAGVWNLRARITMNEGHFVEVLLPIELGLKDLEVTASAVVDAGDLILRHTVINRTDGVLHFRGSAVVPGRERQYRPLSNLDPGETQVLAYRFTDGRELIGSKVRLELREANDGPRTHSLEVLVP